MAIKNSRAEEKRSLATNCPSVANSTRSGMISSVPLPYVENRVDSRGCNLWGRKPGARCQTYNCYQDLRGGSSLPAGSAFCTSLSRRGSEGRRTFHRSATLNGAGIDLGLGEWNTAAPWYSSANLLFCNADLRGHLEGNESRSPESVNKDTIGCHPLWWFP
jgi:hypothetical protein